MSSAAAPAPASDPKVPVPRRLHVTGEAPALAAARVCEAAAEPRLVVLSGGSFQNPRLLASTREMLLEPGFRVLSHRLVPPNDGGLSYGQAAVAAERISSCA